MRMRTLGMRACPRSRVTAPWPGPDDDSHLCPRSAFAGRSSVCLASCLSVYPSLSLSSGVTASLQAISMLCSDHYPETLGKMFIINAPYFFQMAWAIIRRWLDDRTKDKISILGSDYKSTFSRSGTSGCRNARLCLTDLLFCSLFLSPVNSQARPPFDDCSFSAGARQSIENHRRIPAPVRIWRDVHLWRGPVRF